MTDLDQTIAADGQRLEDGMNLDIAEMNRRQEQDSRLLAESPTGVIYGYEITWGSSRSYATGYFTHEAAMDARAEEFAHMKEMGWTPPRWWQIWRSGDTRP